MRVSLGINRIVPAGTATRLQRATAGTGAITAASNASPIVVTCSSHGLVTGDVVTIVGVGGNTAANGSWTVTKVSASTFSLNNSTGNAAYTSGGTWYAIPGGTQFISITADTAAVRYTLDGTTPVAGATGTLLAVGIPPVSRSFVFSNFQFINDSTGGALNIEFFKNV